MFTDDGQFENEVRRIARLLWPSARYGGAAMEDGRERDGIFESEDFVHIIECTVSRSKQKAVEDLQKIQKLMRSLEVRHANKFIKGWFITLHEPTADQRTLFQKVRGRIVAVSFDQFRPNSSTRARISNFVAIIRSGAFAIQKLELPVQNLTTYLSISSTPQNGFMVSRRSAIS